jgi:hypothetical protein
VPLNPELRAAGCGVTTDGLKRGRKTIAAKSEAEIYAARGQRHAAFPGKCLEHFQVRLPGSARQPKRLSQGPP